MLSGPSFRSAFVLSINSLILSGFPLTSFHLVETSLSAFSWLYTLVLVCVQLSKNITKYHLFIIIHIFNTYFAVNLFYLHTLKTKRNYAEAAARGPRPATLFKKRLWHRCFPVNFVKFLRTPFLQNTFGRLLFTMEHQRYRVCEQTKSKQKQNQVM